MHDHATILDADEWLRRRADERGPSDVDEEHVRRRIDVAQSPVEGERLGCGPHVEALREDDLDAVALVDQVTGLRDARAVLVGRSVRGHGAHGTIGLGRQRDRRIERREHAGDPALGALALARHLVRDHQERVADVVEADDGVVYRERGLG